MWYSTYTRSGGMLFLTPCKPLVNIEEVITIILFNVILKSSQFLKKKWDSNIWLTLKPLLHFKGHFKRFKDTLLQRFTFPWLIQLEQKRGVSNFKLRIFQHHKNMEV
uniref:Uncharacterized protein n=1 Tax=Glossina austeni TaxID=7395 RepID=A0A1A9VQ44_GLOAU